MKYNHKNEGVRYPCHLCSYEGTFKRNLVAHTANSHNENKKKYTCGICDYTTKKRYKLTEHKDAVHEGVVHPCSICDYKGKTKTHLKAHTKNCHSEKEKHQMVHKNNTNNYIKDDSKDASKSFDCRKCNFKSQKVGYLLPHMTAAHKNENEQISSQTQEEQEQNFMKIVQKLRKEYQN